MYCPFISSKYCAKCCFSKTLHETAGTRVAVARLTNHLPPKPARGILVLVEPGYTTLRKPDGSAQMYGKMVIDMRTGDIWGFPTLAQGPYPVDMASAVPPQVPS